MGMGGMRWRVRVKPSEQVGRGCAVFVRAQHGCTFHACRRSCGISRPIHQSKKNRRNRTRQKQTANALTKNMGCALLVFAQPHIFCITAYCLRITEGLVFWLVQQGNELEKCPGKKENDQDGFRGALFV